MVIMMIGCAVSDTDESRSAGDNDDFHFPDKWRAKEKDKILSLRELWGFSRFFQANFLSFFHS